MTFDLNETKMLESLIKPSDYMIICMLLVSDMSPLHYLLWGILGAMVSLYILRKHFPSEEANDSCSMER